MMVPARLMWLAHVLPAAALTITSPQTTPAAVASTSTLTSCGSGNLIENGSFDDTDVESGATWTVLPGGSVQDGYLFVAHTCSYLDMDINSAGHACYTNLTSPI